MRTSRGAVCAVLLLLQCIAAEAEPLSSAELRAAGRAQRESGDFKAAIASFETLLRTGAATDGDELLLAETLAWDKQFQAAERHYREVLGRAPSNAAKLGLARVLLWSGRYPDARRAFAEVPGPEALEGRATAAYWAGDSRTAAREFRKVLADDPNRETARKGLQEIASLQRTSQSVAARSARDDQPFETFATEVTASGFVDPLNRWTASAVRWRLFSVDESRTSYASRIAAGLEHAFPWQHITVAATVGAVRLPGDDTEFVGGATATASIRRSRFQVGFDRRELLTNPAEAYGAVDAGWVQWSYDNGAGRLAAARAERLSYFDRNSGVVAYAYGIAPAFRSEHLSVWGGVSAAWRDTDDNRFYAVRVSSALREPGAFVYTYRGRYIPYWSPRNLREVRAIVGSEARWRRAALHVQIDGGRGRDQASGFGPASGPSPLPGSIFTFEFDRSFTPWRGSARVSIPIGTALSIESEFEHNRTADYHANTFHAVVRRH